ncbi:hypothetical protein G6F65_017843 [Rhizopus arrhizus]|nr:hypothetical protein G6F65_017843 [Rhizopus arrhizus]
MKTGSRTTTAIVPTMIATVRPRKPNAINPNTTPPPMAAQISKKTAMAPHRRDEGAVVHAVPVEAGDHREDDGAPQRAHEHQHDQDVQAQAGEDHADHRGDDHGCAAPPQHAPRVRASARQVLGVDVGHDDGRQRRQVGVGGGGQRPHDQQEEERDAEGRQIGGRHLRDDVVHVAVGGLQPDEQRQQAQHAQADHDGAVADRGGQEGGLDQVFTHGEKALRNGLVADGIGQHGDESAWSLFKRHMFACSMSGPPALKKISGMMMTAAMIIAASCAKSVMTEVRKPDHRV